MSALTEVLARAYYESVEWSGCAGSAWDRMPEHAKTMLIRQARDWLDAAAASGLAVIQLPEAADG